MGWSFRKSVKVGPFRINFGKKGVSSVSLKLGKTTINSKGTISHSFGNGLRYTHKFKNNKRK